MYGLTYVRQIKTIRTKSSQQRRNVTCDNCFGVCPDNSVLKLEGRDREAAGRGYAFDYDFCKGCGICVAECPCGAIEMVPETI